MRRRAISLWAVIMLTAIGFSLNAGTLVVNAAWQVGTAPFPEDTDGDGDFATIQAAVDAASARDRIEIATGVYDEQVIVDKSITLIGSGIETILRPGPDTSEAFELFNSSPGGDRIIASPLVCFGPEGSEIVVQSLQVDCSSLGQLPEGGKGLQGIMFIGTSGKIQDVSVSHVNAGDLSANGIILLAYDRIVDVEVSNCSVSDFRSAAIKASNAGLNASIHSNTVTGTRNTMPVQIGIQLGFGATGSIVENEVRDIAGPKPEIMQWAMGIVVVSSDVEVLRNSVVDCQSGIYCVFIHPGEYQLQIRENVISSSGLEDPELADCGNGIWVTPFSSRAVVNVAIEDNDLTGGGIGSAIQIGEMPRKQPDGLVQGSIKGNQIDDWYYGLSFRTTTGAVTASANTIGMCSLGGTGESGPAVQLPGITADISIDPAGFSEEPFGSAIYVTGVSVDSIQIANNILAGNQVGVINDGYGILDVRENWWGDPTGPDGPAFPDANSGAVAGGLGDKIFCFGDGAGLAFDPWLVEEPDSLAIEAEGS